MTPARTVAFPPGTAVLIDMPAAFGIFTGYRARGVVLGQHDDPEPLFDGTPLFGGEPVFQVRITDTLIADNWHRVGNTYLFHHRWLHRLQPVEPPVR